MEVRVSKVFAKFISDTCKERGIKAVASVVTIPSHAYTFMTGTDEWDAECDYAGNGMYKAICIEWPEGYYAIPRYVTTSDLHREFRSRCVKTWDELKDMVCDMFEI